MNHRGWFFLVILLLAACAAPHSNVKPVAPPGLVGALPPMTAGHTTSAAENYARYGLEVDNSIPPHNSRGDANLPNTIILTPTTVPVADPAWSVYSFDMSSYADQPTLHFSWVGTQPSGNRVWIALANWANNRWEFVANDPLTITLDSFAPYISPTGQMLVAVVIVGDGPLNLRWITLGSYAAPAKPNVYNVSPTSSQPGGTLTLAAQVSGTQPLTYAWDFGGGADPNTSSDATPTVTMGVAGNYNATLSLSNKYGAAVYPFVIHSVTPTWTTHLVGDSKANRFVALDTSWQDHALVAGEMDNSRVALFEFDKDSQLLWNKSYTGLPANRVTALKLAEPETNNTETEVRDVYMTCYQDNGGAPGNAYVVRIKQGGDFDWYVPLGQGIPDFDVIDPQRICVSLAENNGLTRVAVISSDGSVTWAKETGEQGSYPNCACGSTDPSLNEGIYLAGQSNGIMAVSRLSFDGTPIWGRKYDGSGIITDCCHVASTGLVIVGTMPYDPLEQWNTFLVTVRLDGNILAHETILTDPCKPVGLGQADGFMYLTCSTPVPNETKLFIMDVFGETYRAFDFTGFGGLIGAAGQETRFRPAPPGEMDPPPQDPESLIFVGSASTMNVDLQEINVTPADWMHFDSPTPFTLSDVTLPQEDLTITPEAVSYTVDSPAGQSDALYLHAQNAF